MDTNPQAVPALPSDDIGLFGEYKRTHKKKKKKLRSSLTCMYVMHLLLDNANLDHPIMTQMVVSDGEYAVLTSLLIQALLQDNTYSELATMKAGAL